MKAVLVSKYKKFQATVFRELRFISKENKFIFSSFETMQWWIADVVAAPLTTVLKTETSKFQKEITPCILQIHIKFSILVTSYSF